MQKRYVSIWFPHLSTDWFALSEPQLKTVPFVLRTPSHGRMIITGANKEAEKQGVRVGMALADARVFIHHLEVRDDQPELNAKLLKKLAEWCIRFSPVVAVDLPHGLIIDATGCSHLWGGDELYLKDIARRLRARSYDIRLAIANTIGAAWAITRYSSKAIIESGKQNEQLIQLPPEALRLSPEITDRLHKLGLRHIGQFISMPKSSLRRRFGNEFIQRLDQATGQQIETIEPVIPVEPYQERLPCLDPIVTLTGIEIALQQLLEQLCLRLRKEQKGLRTCALQGYRVDGKVEQVQIATHRPTHHVKHLFKLFENKLSTIEPALGIELFVLTAQKVEDHLPQQEKMWEEISGLKDERLSELIDRLAGKVGIEQIHRYFPDEHYWPERSFKRAPSLHETPAIAWSDQPRPLQLLRTPEQIEVTAPIPDYPPMLFRYKGEVHQVIKADGPERIEQEWWIQNGQHRDYYRVEDETGRRYWVFRLGHYDDKEFRWFLHGFFA